MSFFFGFYREIPAKFVVRNPEGNITKKHVIMFKKSILNEAQTSLFGFCKRLQEERHFPKA